MEEFTLFKAVDISNDSQVPLDEVSISYLYTPHTLTALVFFLGTLLYFGFVYDSAANSWQANLKVGMGLAVFSVLLIGQLVFPSGPFIRPHPMFWRLVFGISFIYEIALVVLLVLNVEDARAALTWLSPDLNQPLKERPYASDCSFTWANLQPAIFDRYFLSHFLGWFCKSLMIRDQLFCWTISIGWELIEIAFIHMLPNFAECWWDQWLLDVFMANALGILVGHKVCEYLEVKDYKWCDLYTIPTITGKMKRFVLQFTTPSSWTKVRWESGGAIKKFFYYNALMFSLHLVELNAFFLKHILWVPPENNLNLYRLIVWWLIGMVSLRQIYLYMTRPSINRLGSQTWMAVAIQLTELMIIVKFGQGMFPNTMPDYVFWAWIAFAVLYVLFCLWLFISERAESGSSSASSEAKNK